MKNLKHVRPFKQRALPLLLGLLLATACQDDDDKALPPPTAAAAATSPEAVLAWNRAATVAVARMTDPATGFFVLPHPEARLYAIVHLAMYDALNNIRPQNAPYALQGPQRPGADPDAAVGAAAHDALVALLPDQKAYADSLYQARLATIGAGDAKTQGVALGQAAAAAILARRANDGSDRAQIPFVPGTAPASISLPPFDGPPSTGSMRWLGGKTCCPLP
ncbi:hypothetical protein ACFQT0_09880 [Hymenobacter humi]|uniref:Phosphoesterase n=1 Tax=Hymenobacter humi TaxID=1411620 RepID=A0ABW2U6J0_9BACT